MALLQRVCELDLEGIVAKQKFGPYVTEREHSTWFKILNREYSQKDGREELFERERHQEPVAGWHVCVLACEALRWEKQTFLLSNFFATFKNSVLPKIRVVDYWCQNKFPRLPVRR